MFKVPEQADTAGALDPNTEINDELRKSRFSVTCFLCVPECVCVCVCVCVRERECVCVGVKHVYKCPGVFRGALRLKDGPLAFHLTVKLMKHPLRE